MKILYTTYNNFAKRLAMSFIVLMTIGVGSVLGAEYEEMLTLDVAKNAPTGSTSTSLTINDIKSYLQNAAPNTSNIKSATNKTGDVYKGKGSGGDGIPQKCLKIGKASGSGGFTFTIADSFDDIAKVVLVGYGWKTTTAVSVNNLDALKPTKAATEVSFEYILGTPTKTISISVATSAFCATQIILYKEAASKCAYTVTFNSNDGTNSTSSQEFTCGEKKALTANSFSRTGYTFTEWNTKADGSGDSYTNQQSVNLSSINNDNIPLYAQWTANKYTVQFNANDGTGTMNDQSFTYDIAQNLTANAFEKYGHTFAGWSKASNGSVEYIDGQSVSNLTSTNNATVNLYAQWTEKPLTNYRTSCTTETIVTLDPNGGTISNTDGWMENGNGTYSKTHEGTEITLPTATKTNYIFGGWYNGETKYESIPSDLVESITLTAKWLDKQDAEIYWDPESVTVTIDADGNTLPVFNNPNEIEGITFSSSNSSVVAVDANGVITLGSTGTTATVTITATFDGNETYAAKTVTCSITVHPSNCKWVETNTIEDGDEVVITMTGTNGKTYTFENTENTNSAPLVVEVNNISGTYITSVADGIKWVVNKDGDELTFKSYLSDNYLYCINNNNGVRVGNTGSSQIFTIDNESGYLKHTVTNRYLGVYNNQDWRCYTDKDKFAGQTLKFYKKECIASDEYWIIYNLENVTCNSEKPNYIGTDGEIELYFSANSGYKLPEQVSITMGGNPLSEDAFAWEAEEGLLYIIPDGGITGNLVITIEGCELLAVPTNLNATKITSSSAVLTWDNIEHAEQYQVHVTDDDDSTEDIITTTSNTYFEITGLKSASPYLWGVTPIATGYCGITQEAEYFETLDVYTVTFNSNGGTAVEPQTVDAGSKITAPANPSAAGYTFNYWYTTDANVPFDFNTPITGNTTLNAKWTPNVYTITFYKQSGTGGTDNATVTFNSNNYSVSTIEAPTREKYAFGGYYTEQHGAGILVVDTEGNWLKNVAGYTDANGNWIKAENTHLYAKWTAIYTITWVVNNNTETPYHTSTVLSGSTIDQLPTPPADDLFADCDVNAFVGWSTDNIGFDPDPTAPTDLFKTVAEAQNKIGAISADKKFYAVYATTTNTTITFDASDVSGLTNNNLTWTDETSGISLTLSAGQRYTNGTPNTFTVTQGSSNYCQITAPSEMLMSKVVVELSGSNYKVNSVSSGWSLSTSSTTQTITGSGTDLKMSATSSYQIRIKTAEVTYTTYTNFITRCTALPDPVWGGATIDNAVIPVNCGSTTSNSHAAQISFPAASNYNLYKDITIEASSGFVLSTSRDAVEYQTSVTLSPTQSGTNAGTFANKYVYVRAVAPAMSDEDFTGTITISGKQLVQDQVIEVTAEVSCTQYTLTFNDQGQTKTVEGFAGTSVVTPEPWAGICTEPIHYVFDGWAEATVANGSTEYTKVTFPYSMPGQNKTLYAVYRYAEDGSEPVNGFVKVTEALSDWTGDYVIVNETAKKAIGNAYKNDKTLIATDVTIIDNKIHNPTDDVIWQIRKSDLNYTMYNADASKYAYITGGDSKNAGLSDAVQYINISWGSSPTTVRVIGSGDWSVRCFSYYINGNEWRTYAASGNNVTGALYKLSNKSLLYTSSLICGEISVEEDNVVATSAKDQKVKVNVPIKVSSYYNDVVNVTGVGESTFSVAAIENVAVNTDETVNLELTYSPSEYDHLDNETITLTASNGATTTFQVKGRSLPENFVIAAKAGNEWVALTAKVGNGTQVAVPIIVDNKATPTKASVALNTTQYQLFGLKTNNRYTANGTAVHLYSTQTQKVLNASTATSTKTYLNTDATQANAEVSQNALFYEWKLVSKDLVHYTITNSNQTADWENNRILGYSAATGMWGMYSKGTNINQDLFLLPVETVLTEIDMEVMEWGENSIALRIPTDAPENIQLTLGENTSEAKALTNLNADGSASDLYKVEGLTLNSNDCEVMMITDADNTTQGTLVRKPIIITGEVESITYTSDDCPHCDVVVLKDAKLKAGSNHLDFAKIYVYPGGKLMLDGNSLGVKQQVYLRGGYSWLNQSTYALPEVYLNGDINFNGSNNIIYDYYIQNYKYYQFALPYTVPLAKVTDEAGVADFPVWVKHYNGALRAADAYATSWEWYYGDNFERGEGYIIAAQPRQVGNTANRPLSIIRFPLGNKVFNTTNGLESDLSITTIAHGIDGYKAGTVTANNVGWNFVGNPFLSTWKGDIGHKQLIKHPNEANWDGSYTWADSDVKYITIMSAESGSDYAQYIASETELKPFFPFFMQETAEGGTGSINFATANRIKKAPAKLYADEPREAFVQIEIITDGVEDQTGVFVSDTYSDDIDFDDYEKMFGSSADKSKLWLVHDNKRMAFEAMTEASAAANIALGYRAPKTGTYTFAINEDVSALNEIVGVYLTDHELGVSDYNLLYNTYEFETEATNYNDKRFTIRIVLSDDSNGVVTGVGNIGTMKDGIYKFFYQDKMYIYNSGIIYDGTGKRVTNINK